MSNLIAIIFKGSKNIKDPFLNYNIPYPFVVVPSGNIVSGGIVSNFFIKSILFLMY